MKNNRRLITENHGLKNIKRFVTVEEHLVRQQQLNMPAEECLHHSLEVKTSALRVPDR
jgi:hypothetical protein